MIKHNLLCAEWIELDFRPIVLVEHIGFNNVIKNRINEINRQIIIRAPKTLSLEIDQVFSELLENVKVAGTTTDLWKEECGEGGASFTLCYIYQDLEYKNVVLLCFILPGKHREGTVGNVYQRNEKI